MQCQCWFTFPYRLCSFCGSGACKAAKNFNVVSRFCEAQLNRIKNRKKNEARINIPMASERHRKCVYATIRWVKRQAATAAASSSLFGENSDSRNGIYVFRICHCVCHSAVAAVGGYSCIFVVFSLRPHIDTYSHKTALDRQISHSSWIYEIFANAIADTICGAHTFIWRLAQALGAGKHCTWQPSDMNKFVLVTEFHLHSACLGQRYQFTVLCLWFSMHGRARTTLPLALCVWVCQQQCEARRKMYNTLKCTKQMVFPIPKHAASASWSAQGIVDSLVLNFCDICPKYSIICNCMRPRMCAFVCVISTYRYSFRRRRQVCRYFRTFYWMPFTFHNAKF